VEVVCGVDPAAPGGDQPFPVHSSLDEALAGEGPPDLAVVATPTDAHVEDVDRLLQETDALVLSEKPLTRYTQDLATLQERHTAAVLRARVRVAHHFAFSPEVIWAGRTLADHPEWGPPRRIVSVFNDPYARRPSRALRSYVSSWVDSGPNQLSLLSRFTAGWRVTAHTSADDGHRSVTELLHDGGTASLVTNWVAGDSSKQTSIHLPEDVEVRLDHTAMTGVLLVAGRVVEHLGYTGTASRKAAHYRGLYDDVLAAQPSRFSGFELASDITALLEEVESAGQARLRWRAATAPPCAD
jgi:predicted dehydrogenase